MGRLVERRVPELLVTRLAGDPDVAHAPAALASFPRRRADAGFPADLSHAGPQLVTKRAAFRLVFENRYRHRMVMPRPAAGHASGSDFSWLLRLQVTTDARSLPASTPPAAAVPRPAGRSSAPQCRGVASRYVRPALTIRPTHAIPSFRSEGTTHLAENAALRAENNTNVLFAPFSTLSRLSVRAASQRPG
jgi:hypothetical protein